LKISSFSMRLSSIVFQIKTLYVILGRSTRKSYFVSIINSSPQKWLFWTEKSFEKIWHKAMIWSWEISSSSFLNCDFIEQKIKTRKNLWAKNLWRNFLQIKKKKKVKELFLIRSGIFLFFEPWQKLFINPIFLN